MADAVDMWSKAMRDVRDGGGIESTEMTNDQQPVDADRLIREAVQESWR